MKTPSAQEIGHFKETAHSLVLDADSGHFVLGPSSEIEGMPGGEGDPTVALGRLCWTGCLPLPKRHEPALSDLYVGSAPEPRGAGGIRSGYDQEPEWGGRPDILEFRGDSQLHNAVHHHFTPDKDDSLGVPGLAHLLSISTDSLPPGLAPMSMKLATKTRYCSRLAPRRSASLATHGTELVCCRACRHLRRARQRRVLQLLLQPGGRVLHTAIYKFDYDGDGLSDLWMCRGNDPKRRGTWTLALNRR